MAFIQPPSVQSLYVFYVFAMRPGHPRQLTDGTATVQFSTDPELLKRALKDITDKYNVDPIAAAPTHLLLYNNINLKVSTTSTQVWQI